MTVAYQPKDKMPPACVDSERVALAIMLYEPRLRHHFLDAGILPDHFVYTAHKLIVEEILAATATGAVISPIRLIEILKDHEAFNVFGGAQRYIGGTLLSGWQLVTEMEVPGVIERLKDFACRRFLVGLADDLATKIWFEVETPAKTVAAEFADIIGEDVLSTSTATSHTSTLGGAVSGVMGDIEQGRLPYRMYAGTERLDRMLGGWKKGLYYVIAGRPGMGKSTVGPSLLMQTARHGHRVLYVSLEMTTDEITQRLLSDAAYSSDGNSVAYQDIAEQRLTDQQKWRLKQSAEYVSKQPFIIADMPGLGVAGLRQLIKSMQRKHGTIDVVCIDHMGLLQPAQSYRGNKVAETEEVSNEMKRLAKDLDVAVVALMQLNRGAEQRDDKRPTLSDLRWSGAIEQDADVVLMLYREEYYIAHKKKPKAMTDAAWAEHKDAVKNRLDVIIAKNRGGRTGDLRMFADMACCHVRDVA
jgi:replicative DNA helicase